MPKKAKTSFEKLRDLAQRAEVAAAAEEAARGVT